MTSGECKYKVSAPDYHAGDVLGELSSRGGAIESADYSEGTVTYIAKVPRERMRDFAGWLSRVTRTQGQITEVLDG